MTYVFMVMALVGIGMIVVGRMMRRHLKDVMLENARHEGIIDSINENHERRIDEINRSHERRMALINQPEKWN